MPKEHKEKIIVISGAFNPLTTGDLVFLRGAKKLGDWLIVGLHSDEYCKRNYRTLHRPMRDRANALLAHQYVDEVFRFNDEDNTACYLLRQIKLIYPYSDIIFISRKSKKDTLETKISGVRFNFLGDIADKS